MRTLDQIREAIHERQKWSLADQNRDSAMFLQMLDELAQHIQKIKNDID